MTTTTRNEAAERLRNAARVWVRSDARIAQMGEILEEALAAERRATVERIRESVNRSLVEGDRAIGLVHLDTILDEEATR